jgi:hypothetical protein
MTLFRSLALIPNDANLKIMRIYFVLLTESLDHLEHVMGPCWCFWAGPHHNCYPIDPKNKI